MPQCPNNDMKQLPAPASFVPMLLSSSPTGTARSHKPSHRLFNGLARRATRPMRRKFPTGQQHQRATKSHRPPRRMVDVSLLESSPFWTFKRVANGGLGVENAVETLNDVDIMLFQAEPNATDHKWSKWLVWPGSEIRFKKLMRPQDHPLSSQAIRRLCPMIGVKLTRLRWKK